MLKPETCGASRVACAIINETFLSLDGFAGLRASMSSDYGPEHFGATLARIVDRELLADREFLDHAFLDRAKVKQFMLLAIKNGIKIERDRILGAFRELAGSMRVGDRSMPPVAHEMLCAFADGIYQLCVSLESGKDG